MSAAVSSVSCTHGLGFRCRQCWPTARAPRVTEARIGDKVTHVCGPGEFADLKHAREVGTVYGIEHTRWGARCRVKWADDSGRAWFDTAAGFTLVGIGQYLHRDGVPVVKFGAGR